MSRLEPGGPAPSPASAVFFSEAYYRRLLAEFGYASFDVQRFDFTFCGLDATTLNARYLCHHRAGDYLRVPATRRIVTTGFGMSGVPHLATVTHLLKVIELQRGGERCQIVLGDLDAYNGKNKVYAEAAELAERFAKFAVRLGFDPEGGVLRRQEHHLPALETMYLLGRHLEQSDFDGAEEDNHGYYAELGVVDPTMTFRRALSLSLMAADFVALGQNHDAVLVVLGVDEHRYVRVAQRVLQRVSGDSPLRADFALSAAYTRMVPGLGGHPKFSKSLPGSGIDVTTSADDIRRLLATGREVPEESATFQLMCQLPGYDGATLTDLYGRCRLGDPSWHRAVSQFTDQVVALVRLWPR